MERGANSYLSFHRWGESLQYSERFPPKADGYPFRQILDDQRRRDLRSACSSGLGSSGGCFYTLVVGCVADRPRGRLPAGLVRQCTDRTMNVLVACAIFVISVIHNMPRNSVSGV